MRVQRPGVFFHSSKNLAVVGSPRPSSVDPFFRAARREALQSRSLSFLFLTHFFLSLFSLLLKLHHSLFSFLAPK